MNVIEPGQQVWIGVAGDRIKATVSAVCIYPNAYVTYQVAWWDGRRRYEEWVKSHEVEQRAADTLKIGFGE